MSLHDHRQVRSSVALAAIASLSRSAAADAAFQSDSAWGHSALLLPSICRAWQAAFRALLRLGTGDTIQPRSRVLSEQHVNSNAARGTPNLNTPPALQHITAPNTRCTHHALPHNQLSTPHTHVAHLNHSLTHCPARTLLNPIHTLHIPSTSLSTIHCTTPAAHHFLSLHFTTRSFTAG